MMRGTYQVEFNIREREREKERALDENPRDQTQLIHLIPIVLEELRKKIEYLEDELKKAKISSTD